MENMLIKTFLAKGPSAQPERNNTCTPVADVAILLVLNRGLKTNKPL